MNYQKIKEQMISFLKEETSSIGVKGVTVGLSGGLDSASLPFFAKRHSEITFIPL